MNFLAAASISSWATMILGAGGLAFCAYAAWRGLSEIHKLSDWSALLPLTLSFGVGGSTVMLGLGIWETFYLP